MFPLGIKVGIVSRTNGNWLDGRAKSGDFGHWTNRNPIMDGYLQWTIYFIKGSFTLYSCTSKCYLCSRDESGYAVTVRKQNPNSDPHLRWNIKPTGEKDFFTMQNVSSGNYLFGKKDELYAYAVKSEKFS